MLEPHFTFQSLVPVRATASDAAEMVTQLLFGDLVDVLARDRQWLQVRVAADGYTGWIDQKMVLPVDQAWLDAVLAWEYVFAPGLALTGKWQGTALPLHLSLGARFPRTVAGDNTLLEVAIGDWSLELHSSQVCHYAQADVAALLQVSARYLGAPYLWGGKSLWGIDCSGFTQMVFGICGTALPRDAWQQAACGTEVAFEDRTAGDLAFFVNAAGKVHHVGLVLADGNVRHAAGHVHDAPLTPSGIIGKYTGKQTHTLCNIKRIV
ncbi:MAG TPA: NlpC/P60 family protein [Bacteroidia bacterium]|nr:NlpC/P60 family protein [Bacteroidia bacterium]